MVDQHFKLCFFFGRRFKLRPVEAPEHIKELFSHYSENGAMNVDQLREFLIEVQGEANATREIAQDILIKCKHHLHLFQHKELHLESFFRYLLGSDNVALREPGKVYHDMNAPLAHYFVFTGHNSYLTGNQFSSKCSVRPIIKALKNGVRVIELDLWPRGNDVVVRHGGTVTRSVKLDKCLRAIKENGFHASEYPVIITFEDHLNPILRLKVAKMVTETFGHMLFCPETDLVEFPSPEFLKGKILISTKKPEDAGNILDPLEIEISQDVNALEDDETEDDAPPEYKQIISIHAGKLRGGTVAADLCTPNYTSKVRRLSLSEDMLLRNVKENHGEQFLRFSQKNLLRIYPKGTRLFSSNFDPLTAWVNGAQMVAFNMQGNDEHLRLMQGMFRANGGCGYIKKPEILLSCEAIGEVFDPQVEAIPIKTTLKVKVYMGEGWHLDFHHTHFDTWSPPDFYAKIGIAGVPADKRPMVKTKTENNQWAPAWNAEFEFPLHVPELAFLLIQVQDEDPPLQGSDFAGQTCLPISELRTGVRSVPLYDKKGTKYRFVKLLMHFRFV